MEYRKATIADLLLYFTWVNDEDVVNNSIQQRKITLEEHTQWFEKAVQDPDKLLLVFSEEKIPAGQVRIEKKDGENVLTISLDKAFRNKGHAKKLLLDSCREFTKSKKEPVQAYVNESNTASSKSFLKSGFTSNGQVKINGTLFNKYVYRP